MRRLGLLLLSYVALAMALPYVLAGDRTLLTFSAYVALAVASIATSYAYLRGWSRLG